MVKKVTVIKAAKEQKHTQEERRLESVRVCQSQYRQSGTGNFLYWAVEYYTEKSSNLMGVCRGVCG